MQRIKNTAIFIARGGSERVKNKNIKKFHGKPILYWTHKIIKKSKFFQNIVLSSDSEKILKVGKKIGFDILIKRPKNISDNYSNTEEVVNHAIKDLSKNMKIENICCVYPCSVFMKISSLKKAFMILKKNPNSLIFPIMQHSHPLERSLILSKDNRIKFYSRKSFYKRTQDLKPKYFDTGQFYLAKNTTWLKKNKTRFGIEISKYSSIDIDTVVDWNQAKLMFKS
tara:strand:+ start:36 stop:710 length:675 start_codon:yes stop_codon:yes gene_type:complete